MDNSVGPVGADVETVNGAMFRYMMAPASLCAINTWVGAGSPTWTHSGGKQRRLDYICVPAEVVQRQRVVKCEVLHTVDLTLGSRPDHAAVGARLALHDMFVECSSDAPLLSRENRAKLARLPRQCFADETGQTVFQGRLAKHNLPTGLTVDELACWLAAHIVWAAAGAL